MNITRTLALFTSIALLLTACNNDAEEAGVAVNQNTNPLLAHAPADTPYVFAALEPIPENVTNAYIARVQPLLDVVASKVQKFNEDYAQGKHEDNQMAAVAAAVLDELGGSISAEGLKKLGISMQSNNAMYGMGVFPVIRLGLSDSQAFRDAIGRIEARVGFEIPVKTFDGTDYWNVSDDDSPVGVYIAVLDQQLAISLFPEYAQDRLLPAFLGHEMPAQSLASSNALAILNHENGYTGYGSGIVDIEKLSNELTNPDSDTYSYLSPEEQGQLPTMDASCIAEIKTLVANIPRLTIGTTSLTSSEYAMRYELEIDSLMAVALSGLVSDIPSAVEGDQLLNASVALKVGKLRTFLLERATAMAASPYQCEHLLELNENARQMAEQLTIPMPPMVNNLMGIRVSVDEINPEAAVPVDSGLIALHVEKPEMFAGMASMMIPGFEELDLANQSEPVTIPSEMFHMQDLDIFALMTDDAIGVAAGEESSIHLKEFMTSKAPGNGTFFSLSYDSARQAELKSSLIGDHNLNPDTGDREFDEALKASYLSLLGTTRLDMRFTDDGLVMDSKMTFK